MGRLNSLRGDAGTRTERLRARRAFTLVEMVVAIGIIVFLTGLIVSSGVALMRAADVRATRATITLLDQSVGEWEREADRRFTHGAGPGYELQSDTPFVFVITEMIEVMQRAGASRDRLAGIEPDAIYVYADGPYPPWVRTFADQAAHAQFIGSMTVLDAWGTPIYATPPGRLATSTDPPEKIDADGTIETVNEAWYGVARNQQVCFVSAGPDRRFGLIYEFAGIEGGFPAMAAAIAKAREDNIRSHPPAEPYAALGEILVGE